MAVPELVRQRIQYLLEHGGVYEPPRDQLRVVKWMVVALIALEVVEVVLLTH